MIVARAAKEWFLLIAQRWRATLPCFLGGVLLYLGAAALWPKQYTGTALVGLNPSLNWQPDVAKERATEAEAIRQASRLPAWAAIVDRLRLSPETVADGRLADAADFLASQVSIQQIDDPKHGGPVLRVSYAAPSRELAQSVTEAVAGNLVNPVSAPATAPLSTSAAPGLPPAPLAPSGSNPGRRTDPKSSLQAESSFKAPSRRESHKIQPARQPSQAPGAQGARRLQAQLDEGAKLESALSENGATMSGLRQQLAEMDQKAASEAIAKPAPPKPEPRASAPKAGPQIQSLREELARSQQALDDLRKRYTEDYPDVVAAKEKAQELLLDISRLEALDGRSAPAETPAQASAPPRAPRDESARNRISQRLNEAEALDAQLRQALEHNRAQVAHLQAEMAASETQDAAKVAAAKDSDEAATAPIAATTQAAAQTQAAEPPPLQSAGLANPGAAAPDSSQPSVADSAPISSTGVGSPAPGDAPLSIAEGPMIAVSPLCFAAPLSWLFSLAFGSLAAFAAAWLAERRDPSIRSERMLRQLLPNPASFLGGIPRVRHEVIPD